MAFPELVSSPLRLCGVHYNDTTAPRTCSFLSRLNQTDKTRNKNFLRYQLLTEQLVLHTLTLDYQMGLETGKVKFQGLHWSFRIAGVEGVGAPPSYACPAGRFLPAQRQPRSAGQPALEPLPSLLPSPSHFLRERITSQKQPQCDIWEMCSCA